MFRKKRSDTKIAAIEKVHRVNLNARSDMLLGNLLDDRGFNTLSELLAAYRRQLPYHPRRRRTFISFHAEDKMQVQGFRLMAKNEHVDLDIFDSSVRAPINSKNSSYIKERIRQKISRSSVLICLIGNGTAWRDWVDWEIRTAYNLRKGVCGVRLKGSRGRTPPELVAHNAPVASWDMVEIVKVIECAAARRS